jgi:glycosyltransferase involved in cell wall biosynthesis
MSGCSFGHMTNERYVAQRTKNTGENNRLKIAVVTSFPADPARPCGGVEAVSVNLVSALAKYPDLDIHVVTTDHACDSLICSKWNLATIHRLPWRGRKVLTHVIGPGRNNLTHYLNRLEPDLIHAHDFYGIMVRKLAFPRVFTVHGFIHADTYQAKKRFYRIRSFLWKNIECRSWADQPHIIAISPYVREKLSGLAKGTIHDIDNPISEECFRVQRNERPNTIFSSALLGPRKNTLGLLDSFRRLIQSGVSATLRLAGNPVSDEYETCVKKYIQENHLSNAVTLLGRISSEQVREELSHAGVYSLVSFEEGSPMGIAEAMAAGLPIITSNRCGMPYMVRDGETGILVNPFDHDEIARAISSLLRDDQMRIRMGRLARKTALERFHPQSVAARTRRVYFKALHAEYECV